MVSDKVKKRADRQVADKRRRGAGVGRRAKDVREETGDTDATGTADATEGLPDSLRLTPFAIRHSPYVFTPCDRAF